MPTRAQKTTIGTIVVALLGLGAAVAGNIEPITNVWCSHLPGCSPSPDLDGQWLGIFRENSNPSHKDGKSKTDLFKEAVELHVHGDRLNGSVRTHDNTVRTHNITSGSFAFKRTDRKEGFIAYATVGNDPVRGIGAVSYTLKGNFVGGPLAGYWTGWDPEAQKIMTCPYLLTREDDFEKIKGDVCLQQPCYPK
jgi:hypothetical protein